MIKNITYFLLLLLIFFSFSTPSDAEPIRISAAKSLTDALQGVVSRYQQKYPDQQFQFNFASSGALARQISAGAPADIFISANPKWMAHLVAQGLIADQTQRDLVRNHLVFVGRAGTVNSIVDLPGLERIAIGSPQATPVGEYTVKALKAAGLYFSLVDKNSIITAKDVRQALLYADRGEVDGAFVYQTDARLATTVKVLFIVSQDLYPRVVYPTALTKSASGNAQVEKFFAYLLGSAAGQTFAAYGFSLPEQN